MIPLSSRILMSAQQPSILPDSSSSSSSSSLPLSPWSLSSIFSNTQSFRPSCCSALSTLLFELETHTQTYLSPPPPPLTVVSPQLQLTYDLESSQYNTRSMCSSRERKLWGACYLLQWEPPVCFKWKTPRLNETLEQMAPCERDLNSSLILSVFGETLKEYPPPHTHSHTHTPTHTHTHTTYA